MQFPTWTIMKHHEASWSIMKHHEASWTIMNHHEPWPCNIHIYILYIIIYQNIWLSPGSFHQSPQRFPLRSSCTNFCCTAPVARRTLRRRTFSSCQSMPPASWPRRRNWPMIPGGGGKRATVGDQLGKSRLKLRTYSKSFRELFGVFLNIGKLCFVFFTSYADAFRFFIDLTHSD